ncbi:hypothetical protein [Peribacillus frigoritolerans]|uniref:hypothetical protein n=1 Tax=Peribacillus frigoritolerans TaxID=450367 RepID=UPI0033056A96
MSLGKILVSLEQILVSLGKLLVSLADLLVNDALQELALKITSQTFITAVV